jgi:hypothetical protein
MPRKRPWRAVYQKILAPRSNQLSVTDLSAASLYYLLEVFDCSWKYYVTKMMSRLHQTGRLAQLVRAWC